MSFRKLAESLDGITKSAMMDVKSKGDVSVDATVFFTSGTFPDGSKWKDKIIPKLGFDNSPVVTKEKKKATKDGMIYTARLRFAPGKGGGAGIGIDPTASNELFARLGTDRQSIRGVSNSYAKFVKKNQRGLNEALRRWLKNPENFLYTIVGWTNRKDYRIEDVMLTSIRYENPMVDPNRRQWPAGRTEIWVPIVADISVVLKALNK